MYWETHRGYQRTCLPEKTQGKNPFLLHPLVLTAACVFPSRTGTELAPRPGALPRRPPSPPPPTVTQHQNPGGREQLQRGPRLRRGTAAGIPARPQRRGASGSTWRGAGPAAAAAPPRPPCQVPRGGQCACAAAVGRRRAEASRARAEPRRWRAPAEEDGGAGGCAQLPAGDR